MTSALILCDSPLAPSDSPFLPIGPDQLFHEAAYLADDRQDLLNAINSFLDLSIVLPPSEMGGDELLHSVSRFQKEMLRKREEQEVKLLEPKSMEEKGERPLL